MNVKFSQNEKVYSLKDGKFLLGFNAMNNKNNSSLNETSILIDSGSNCSIFKNSDRLANIRNCDELLRVYTKFGYQDSNMKGHYKNFYKVWFNRSLCLIYCPYHK